MAHATKPQVGRSVGHERAVFMATSGHFYWPPVGTSEWPLTLSLAVPYCDIVFADAAARDNLLRRGLATRFDTVLPRTPEELITMLGNMADKVAPLP